jgi:hypothetical protein
VAAILARLERFLARCEGCLETLVPATAIVKGLLHTRIAAVPAGLDAGRSVGALQSNAGEVVADHRALGKHHRENTDARGEPGIRDGAAKSVESSKLHGNPPNALQPIASVAFSPSTEPMPDVAFVDITIVTDTKTS